MNATVEPPWRPSPQSRAIGRAQFVRTQLRRQVAEHEATLRYLRECLADVERELAGLQEGK